MLIAEVENCRLTSANRLLIEAGLLDQLRESRTFREPLDSEFQQDTEKDLVLVGFIYSTPVYIGNGMERGQYLIE